MKGTIGMHCDELDQQRAQYLRAIFDTFPHPCFIVDEDVRIHDFNSAAEALLGVNSANALFQFGGDAFHCLQAEKLGCGKGARCSECVIRNGVRKALAGKETCREIHRAKVRRGETLENIELLVTAGLLPYEDPPQVLLVLENLSETSRRRKPGTRASANNGKPAPTNASTRTSTSPWPVGCGLI